jgi:hypothetical protein
MVNGMPTCSVNGCDRPSRSSGKRGAVLLCNTHRLRLHLHGDVRADVPIAEKYWSKRGIKRGAEYHDLVRKDACEVCGSTTALVVDHNHKCCSGKWGCEKCVRGTLCQRCNYALGGIESALASDTMGQLIQFMSRA